MILSVVMFDTTDFLSDPIPSKTQGGIGNNDLIPILSANTSNVTGQSKKQKTNKNKLYFKLKLINQCFWTYCIIN